MKQLKRNSGLLVFLLLLIMGSAEKTIASNSGIEPLIHAVPADGRSIDITLKDSKWSTEEVMVEISNQKGEIVYLGIHPLTDADNTIHVRLDQSLDGGEYILFIAGNKIALNERFTVSR